MFDYEKISEKVMMPGDGREEKPADSDPAIDPAELKKRMAEKEYLPLNHEKYQGIATAKGYAPPSENSPRIKRVRYSHEAMIEILIQEPKITQRELAARFEVHENWISRVIGSDAFQAALAKRRDDILDPFIIATVEERFRGLAMQSIDIIAEKLETTKNVDVALKALDVSSKALGFGARAGQQSNVQNNFVVQLPPKIESSSEWSAAHTIEGAAK